MLARQTKSPRRRARGGARIGGEPITSLHILSPKRPIVKRRGGLSKIVTQCQDFKERYPEDWRHIAISIELDKLIPA